jgi:hypothetical protein
MTQPARNRDGLWVIYHRRTGRVEEHEEDEARVLLERGSHVPWPGSGFEGAESPEWPLQITPEESLERNPEGPNADLARTILGLDG